MLAAIASIEQWQEPDGQWWRREGGRLLYRQGMVWREYRLTPAQSDEARDAAQTVKGGSYD